MAVLFFVTGVLDTLVGLAGHVFWSTPDVETMMPDHEVAMAS